MKFFAILLLVALNGCQAFKFMSSWKLPSFQDAAMEQKIKDRFGDKSKLFVA